MAERMADEPFTFIDWRSAVFGRSLLKAGMLIGRAVRDAGRSTLLLCFFLWTAGCHSTPVPWTVLSGAEAVALQETCSRPFPKGLYGEWLPHEEDILMAELRLDAAIDAAYGRGTAGRPAFSLYRRQYAGYWRDGLRVLYINAVAPDAASGKWRTKAVMICDGGMITYGALFDLNRQAFDFFFFNGHL